MVKELWYDGDTKQVIDEVVNTYNLKGEMIRNESINFNYYVLYEYTTQGDVKSWFFFEGGLPIQKAEYIFNDEFKNPFQARPGIEYSFAWANSAFGAGKRWYSSEKITFYDEAGNPSVYYEHDPKQTVWQLAPQNYPLQASYVDILTGAPIFNSFEFENCAGQNANSRTESLNQIRSIDKSNASSVDFNSHIYGPQKAMIQKMNRLRKYVKK